MRKCPSPTALFDDRFNDTYARMNSTSVSSSASSQGSLIFVARLGLFGPATYTAEQRTREIGIRKVLGADIASIVTLLSKDFVRLVLVAFLIAAPVAWWVMNQWLLDFASPPPHQTGGYPHWPPFGPDQPVHHRVSGYPGCFSQPGRNE